jgi:hypothetical protein
MMGDFIIDDRLGFDAGPLLDAEGNPIVAPFGGLGKWGRASTPHSGWHYDKENPIFEAYDPDYSDEPFTRSAKGGPICEMCETARIKRIHKLRHADFPGPLYVGIDCAGHLIGDIGLAKDMEKAAGIRAEWRPGRNGKLITRTRGFFLAVKKIGKGYKGMFLHVTSRYRRQSRETYPTPDRAAFYTVLAMLRARRLKPWRQAT